MAEILHCYEAGFTITWPCLLLHRQKSTKKTLFSVALYNHLLCHRFAQPLQECLRVFYVMKSCVSQAFWIHLQLSYKVLHHSYAASYEARFCSPTTARKSSFLSQILPFNDITTGFLLNSWIFYKTQDAILVTNGS